MRSLLLLALIAACSDEAAPTDAGIDTSGLTYRACAADERVGGFEVVLASDYTGTQGQVYDSVLPSSVPTVVREAGSCALVAAPNYACSPTCTAAQVCNAELACVPYPVARAVGTVKVEGLAATVEMAARAPTYFYTNPSSLPQPGYASGAAIRLAADGGDVGAFELLGWGVEALTVTSTQLVIERGVALPMTWEPPSLTGPAKLTISLNINGHGLVGEHVECTVDDTGSFSVPADLITELVDAGASGFPTITLTRSSLDSTSLAPGCVDFRVHSAVKLDVTIPGLQSCDEDDDCTPPATCRGDLTCG